MAAAIVPVHAVAAGAAAGKCVRGKRLARTGIRELQKLDKDFNAYWPLRNKATPQHCSAFLKWRIEDYRLGKSGCQTSYAAPDEARDLFATDSTKMSRPRRLPLPSLAFHVPRVAQAVAEKIQRQQRRHQHAAGKDDQPPVNPDGIDLAARLRQ